ncbi:rho guanine nucleotide exchange factor 11-like isoform X2 [Paramacrobiotus metropolitanus]|uniref:rho guanine nucleotide exchange factor 11-like isoform X2 n=1 Tax=Paramacrobiotus metropolitanus TaxID=2943436 RepID=UPI0024461D37|nr:rho guanine nucleotide exchange factor 11-like isoform X2 [Paramacrobiotus metropolitanus]
MDYNRSSIHPARLNNLATKSEVHNHHGRKGREGSGEVTKSIIHPSPGGLTEDLYQRLVIFQRDAKGYGLTVSGDNPVFVQSVKEDGPAALAGVQKGDRIIKVNGTLVTQSNHTEVVKLIKADQLVTLTLLGKSPTKPINHPNAGSMSNINRHGRPPLPNQNSPPTITAPLPPSQDKQQMYTDNRLQTMNLMREKEMQNIAQLTTAFSANPTDEKLGKDIEAALKRVKHLQDQMLILSVTRAGATGGGDVSGPTSFADRPLPPIPTETVKSPTETGGGIGRTSRKNSGGSGHVRQYSTPEPLHIAGAMLSCPPDSTLLNRSASDMIQPQTDMDVDVIPKKPADSRFRTSSFGEKMFSPPSTPFGQQSNVNGSSNRAHSGFPTLSSIPLTVFNRPAQVDVMSMEDASLGALPSQPAPFLQYSALQQNLPHLSVFMFYLCTNSEPNTLLFHLLSDAYLKGTNTKDMQRWAYELHSTFTLPDAPLELEFVRKVPAISGSIEELLSKPEWKDDEPLRAVFNNARIRAGDVVKSQLAEFQQKRALGMAFGPSEAELQEASTSADRTAEMMGAVLGQWLQYITDAQPEEPENRLDKQAATGTALATFLRISGGKLVKEKDATVSLLDKWPLMLQKEKHKFKPKEKAKKLSTQNGHQFEPKSLTSTAYCQHCSQLIWGASPQGNACAACGGVYHRCCTRHVDKLCSGKSSSRSLPFPDLNFIGRKRSNQSPSAIAAAKKQHDDKMATEAAATAASNTSSDLLSDAPDSDRRLPVGQHPPLAADRSANRDSSATPDLSEASRLSSSTQITRSESLKTQQKRVGKTAGNRKKSDPYHLDREADDERSSMGISENSSSTHSLRSSESPRDSMDNVGDSDLDADPKTIPDWQLDIKDFTLLEDLTPKERKRQDVINELFHTERTHVRNLKVLHQVFYQPMLRDQILPPDILHLIFANLEEMLSLHNDINRAMRRLKKSTDLVGNVGDLLISCFGPASIHKFKLAAAAFCRNQHFGLEALKQRQKKDDRLAQFLQDAERNTLCMRLQLKDIIPTGMQRLTKYPLLLDQLLKYTKDDDEDGKQERAKINVALNNCRDVLDFVNQAVMESDNRNRLKEIQDKIDTGPFRKTLNKLGLDPKSFDLIQHKLIHYGELTWRTSKQKNIDLLVLLLERQLVLITKQDDKLALKFHSNPTLTGSALDKRSSASDSSRYWSPIINLENILIRDVATDKCAFLMFGAGEFVKVDQMYELVAPTANEQIKWKKNIQLALEGMTKLYENMATVMPETATPSVQSGPVAPSQPGETGSHLAPSTDGNEYAAEGERGPPSEGDEAGSKPGESAEQPTGAKTKRPANLLSPSLIVFTVPDIQDAMTVVTPFEQLKRRDRELEEALSSKMRLISTILGVNPDNIEEVANRNPDFEADPRQLISWSSRQVALLAKLLSDATALHHEQLLLPQKHTSLAAEAHNGRRDFISQTDIQPPTVDAHKLETIALNLNRYMTALMKIICQREMENQQLRKDLEHQKEQLRILRSEARSPAHSRPSSFISVSSTGSFPADSLDGDSDHTTLTLSDDYTGQALSVPNSIRRIRSSE